MASWSRARGESDVYHLPGGSPLAPRASVRPDTRAGGRPPARRGPLDARWTSRRRASLVR
ncbi:MAG: hypothetical protein AVDCRST_MAG38-401 [uncultured Solirubrobacteraceae bacterium]|uniref:Uncharacterized protein n=1 Tax=uncultured Solirubrobacteraceae bacterium TaxID=1162706 RepID=A0A6J4R3Q2_9ACTN|nr:MAG: hypothetical protein AVDCRST_MAG38-401 [uncultured Solirubrobacteraceae bacterium]